MQKIKNFLRKFSTSLIIFILLFVNCVFVTKVTNASTPIEPTENQYFELVATQIRDVPGQNRQVIMELWAHDIEFKSMNVRFKFNGTKLGLSNLTSNRLTNLNSGMLMNDEVDFFSYEEEFQSAMGTLIVPYDRMENVLDFTISLDNPPGDETDHIKNTVIGGNPSKVVSTTGGVKIGTMSFQLKAGELDMGEFALVADADHSPVTGIKINLNIANSFEQQSTFRFRDSTASRDANLSQLVFSSGDEDDGTYEEYELNPEFDGEVLGYELELTKNLETIDVTPYLSDENSTIKLKVPKRDEDDNLLYEDDGVTFQYEEFNINNETRTPVILNKPGEPDTVIYVEVTAESGRDTMEYQITIKKIFAILRGRVTSVATQSQGICRSTVKLFKTADVATLFDWDNNLGVSNTCHADALTLDYMNFETDEDGTFEIYAPPGTYDVLIDKAAYLDYVFVGKELSVSTPVDLGTIPIQIGDLDKDGIVGPRDMATLSISYNQSEGSTRYEPDYDFDLNGTVNQRDVAYVGNNYDRVTRTVIR